MSGHNDRRALEAPTRQIAEHSGLDGGVRSASAVGCIHWRHVDLIETFIVDATKVVRVALENTVSVASTLLLTEATLVEQAEKRSAREPDPQFTDS